MRDGHDNLTVELPVGDAPKKRGRKPVRSTGAMDAATRKREQRARQATAIYERNSDELTDAQCLSVLTGKQWRGSAVDKGAWEQLGKLRGFL